jgi:hypothetical protein
VQEEDDQLSLSLSLSLQNRILLALFVEWPFVTWSWTSLEETAATLPEHSSHSFSAKNHK